MKTEQEPKELPIVEFNCAEEVLRTCYALYGVKTDQALRSLMTLGGFEWSGGTCGAVIGALMAIVLRERVVRGEDRQAHEKTYALAQQFLRQFTARHGSIQCDHFLDEILGRSQLSMQVADTNPQKARCVQVVQDTAEILDQILAKEK